MLVLCSDLNTYVCKHNQGQPRCYKLFAEFLASKILLSFGFQMPDFAFIQVKPEHIKPTADCQPKFFKDVQCFGSQHLHESLEFSNFSYRNADFKKIINPMDILKIAWFDIWIANEDRNYNNFNLLLNPEKEGNRIVPIDHGSAFNTLSFNIDRSLVLLTLDDSLINTPQYKLIASKYFKKLSDVNDLINSIYLCLTECEKSFDLWVSEIPENWQISNEYLDALKSNLFAKQWLNETKTHFLALNKQLLNLK